MDMILNYLKGSKRFLEVSVKTVSQYADHFLKIKVN